MTAVTGTITTASQEFPPGTVAKAIRLTLTEIVSGAVLTGDAPLGSLSVSIADVPEGAYTGSISLIDENDAVLGTPVTDPNPLVVEGAPATVTLDVPASLVLSKA